MRRRNRAAAATLDPIEEPTNMADVKSKLSVNVVGKYFVDDSCIDCDACRGMAPDNFSRDPDLGFSFVSRQPAGELEERLCQDALEGCPVEAIGNDGDQP